MRRLGSLVLLLAGAVGLGAGVAAFTVADARAQSIVDEWGAAKFPAPPALKPVKIDNPKETALLAMDFTNQTCSPQRRPRCANAVPKVQKLIAEARA